MLGDLPRNKGIKPVPPSLGGNVFLLFIYFSADLVLCGCTRAFSSSGSRALEHVGFSSRVHGLSCSVACGIFLDQGSKPRPLHC